MAAGRCRRADRDRADLDRADRHREGEDRFDDAALLGLVARSLRAQALTPPGPSIGLADAVAAGRAAFAWRSAVTHLFDADLFDADLFDADLFDVPDGGAGAWSVDPVAGQG